MKPGAFTQLYVHLVFAVKYRERLLTKEMRDELFKYIYGIITHRKHKVIIINGMADHIHILIGLNPYGAFSYGRSQLDDVYKYIANQEMHHRKRTFREEYVELLKRFEIKFEGKYLFDFFD